MNKYVKLILKWILVFFATSIVAFAIVRITPGSPVDLESAWTSEDGGEHQSYREAISF